MCIQHRKCKGALNFLRHVLQAGKVEVFFLLNELDGNVAVGFNFRSRKALGAPQAAVIVENAVVSQSEFLASCITEERMVVSVPDSVSLRGHPGVAHDNAAVSRNAEAEPVRCGRTLVDAQMAVGTVRDPGGVSAAFLTFRCKD